MSSELQVVAVVLTSVAVTLSALILFLSDEKKYALRIWLGLSRKPRFSIQIEGTARVNQLGVWLRCQDVYPPFPLIIDVWEPEGWEIATEGDTILINESRVLGQTKKEIAAKALNAWREIAVLKIHHNWKTAPKPGSFVVTLKCADVTILRPPKIGVCSGCHDTFETMRYPPDEGEK